MYNQTKDAHTYLFKIAMEKIIVHYLCHYSNDNQCRSIDDAKKYYDTLHDPQYEKVKDPFLFLEKNNITLPKCLCGCNDSFFVKNDILHYTLPKNNQQKHIISVIISDINRLFHYKLERMTSNKEDVYPPDLLKLATYLVTLCNEPEVLINLAVPTLNID